MTVSEAERQIRIKEFSALVERQRLLIEQLEKDASDATSAKIIFDSLRVSFSLYANDWCRARCAVEPGRREAALAGQTPGANNASNSESGHPQTPESELKPDPIFDMTFGVALRGRRKLMPVKSDFLKIVSPSDVDGKQEPLPDTAGLSGDDVPKQTDEKLGLLVFRPLTEAEKSEFRSSLDAKGEKILDELMNKGHSFKFAAA